MLHGTYHPPVQENLNIANLVWRDNHHTRPLPFLSSLNKSYLETGTSSHDQSTMGVEPLSGGPRGTNPWQDPNDSLYQKVEMKPYSIPKGGSYDCLEQPFYHVNLMASSGGFPLKIAMDEPGQLNMMVHNEKMRIHPDNPLSAAYATHVIQALEQDPYRGPLIQKMKLEKANEAYQQRMRMKDAYRHDVFHAFDDDTVKRRREATGGDVHDRDIAAWIRGRPPTGRTPIDGQEALFRRPVQNLAVNPLLAPAHAAVMAQIRQGHPLINVAQSPANQLIGGGSSGSSRGGGGGGGSGYSSSGYSSSGYSSNMSSLKSNSSLHSLGTGSILSRRSTPYSREDMAGGGVRPSGNENRRVMFDIQNASSESDSFWTPRNIRVRRANHTMSPRRSTAIRSHRSLREANTGDSEIMLRRKPSRPNAPRPSHRTPQAL